MTAGQHRKVHPKQQAKRKEAYAREKKKKKERKKGKEKEMITCKSQPHAKHLIDTQTLPHTQIQHNLLTTTGDSKSPNITIQALNLATLTATAITQATKDLTGLAGAEFKRLCRLCLETGNRSAHLDSCLELIHDHGLVDDVLEPVPRGFDLAGHICELHPDDGVIDQSLAEGLALVGVFDGFFVANARVPHGLNYDAHTFVVEVCDDNYTQSVKLPGYWGQILIVPLNP